MTCGFSIWPLFVRTYDEPAKYSIATHFQSSATVVASSDASNAAGAPSGTGGGGGGGSSLGAGASSLGAGSSVGGGAVHGAGGRSIEGGVSVGDAVSFRRVQSCNPSLSLGSGCHLERIDCESLVDVDGAGAAASTRGLPGSILAYKVPVRVSFHQKVAPS